MAYNTSYNLDEYLPSPDPIRANQVLDSENSILTPIGIGTSNGSNSNSPQQEPTIEMPLADDLEFTVNLESLLQNCPEAILLPIDGDDTWLECNSGQNVSSYENIFSNIFHQENDDQLRIIAQPAPTSRIRYATDSLTNNGQGHRFIRTDPKEASYEYPTVQFSRKYCDPGRELYIKVTSVTIITDKVPEHYIHPYKIGSEGNYLTDDNTNSLYFPIQEDELITCEKKLQITQTVTLQKDLKPPRPLYEHGTNSFDNQRNTNIRNPKEIITTFQLNNFQLIFAIAEKTIDSKIPVSIPNTEVTSRRVTREVDKKGKHNDRAAAQIIKCIPQCAPWQDGGEVAITMTVPIKNKSYSIRFDFPLYESELVTDVTPIDQKTFSFLAPPCPVPVGDHDLTVRMIINENGTDLGYIEFIYIRSIVVYTIACPRCQSNLTTNQMCNNNKRTRDEVTDVPGINKADISLDMSNLTLNENKNESPAASQAKPPATYQAKQPATTTRSDDASTKFDKYVDQLQEALVTFVRTNDPSKLFRRTRILLTSYDENPPPLHDAIEHGYISLASTIIEQVANMREPNNLLEKRNENGETLLLVGARCNEWKVIELIVKKREDVIEARDKDGNNMLHLLASVKEDAGAETIENILAILSEKSKSNLLKQENKMNETPAKSAQLHGNTRCFELLKDDQADA